MWPRPSSPRVRGGSSFLSQLQCHGGVFLHSHDMPALERTHRYCGRCPNQASWSHLLLASCATLSTAQSGTHSRAEASARNGHKGRGRHFFPSTITARGNQRYKNNSLAGLGHILTLRCLDDTYNVIIGG